MKASLLDAGFFSMMKTIVLPNGRILPRMGLGTWRIGDDADKEAKEIDAIRYGIDQGIRILDTAEMYGEGKSEILLGKAIQGFPRKELFLVSKIYPHNCNASRFFSSLEKSLKRLGTDYLDLYLLHWRTGRVDLKEMVSLMEKAKARGLIRDWGVSNFNVTDMAELLAVEGGENCLADQCLYHLGSRGVEYSLLPFLGRHRIFFMAYSPLAQSGGLREGIFQNAAVVDVARRHGIQPIQVLLSFSLFREDVVSIPKCGSREHVFSLLEAEKVVLDEEDIALLEKSFPKPSRDFPLDMC